ncbi:MAG: AraC family transcriptional regulator [Paraperlucidibaca sp.]
MNPLHQTVSGHVVPAMLQCAINAGIDPALLLQEAGISAHWQNDSSGRLLPLQFANLMRALWRGTNDEFMGFTAQPSRVGTFPLMMHSVLSADTLGQALSHGTYFYRVLTDAMALTLSEHDGVAELELRLLEPERDAGHVLTETILLCWYRLACWLINRRILLTDTHFSYPPPAHEAEYHQLYPCPHHFNQERTALHFDARVLALPITRSRDELKSLIRELPLGFFIKPVFQGSLSHRVRSRLLQSGMAALPSLDVVANELFMTGRTLRRQLLVEGTRYQEIKDELRREHAMALLREPHTSINAVARDVGFREAAVFIKAFKHWTGMTPGEYRAHWQAQRQLARGAS